MMNKLKKQMYIVYVEWNGEYTQENHCILKYADLQTAKSIRRNLTKKLFYNEGIEYGFLVGFVSRKCCLNFRDFENETFSNETMAEYQMLLNDNWEE